MNQTNHRPNTEPQHMSTPSSGNVPPTTEPLPDIIHNQPQPKQPKKSFLAWILVGVLAVITIILLILMLNYAGRANTTQQALDTQRKNGYDEGYAKGIKDQSEVDNKAFQEKLISDTRQYKSPSEFGSFELNLPKSWSWAITPRPSDGTFSGISDPELVDITSKYHTFSLELKREDYDVALKRYQDEANRSSGSITVSDATVSGIAGKRFKGVFDQKNNRKAEIVLVPLREKVMIFKTDNPDQYSDAFNVILSTTKLNP